jgi:chromosome segregation ATPase
MSNKKEDLERRVAALEAKRGEDDARFLKLAEDKAKLTARQDAMEARQDKVEDDIKRLDAEIQIIRRDTAVTLQRALQGLWSTLSRELQPIVQPHQLARLQAVALNLIRIATNPPVAQA